MTTPEIALEIVNLLGTASKQPNELGKFITDFLDASVKWIRPLFLIDDKEDTDFVSFKNNPNDTDSKDIVLAKVKKALGGNDEMLKYFQTLIEEMKKEGNVSTYSNIVNGEKNTFIQGSSGNKIKIINK